MSFWDLPGDAVALVDDSGRSCTYRTLADEADAFAAALPLPASRAVGLLFFDSSMESVFAYLGTLRSRQHVPLLLNPSLNETLIRSLVENYAPEWIVSRAPDGAYAGYRRSRDIGGLGIHARTPDSVARPSPHIDLGVLLSTSGSTGSQKLVRLSKAALDANAESIVSYLGLTKNDRAITSLPLAYSFGMSVLNSHLAAGASVALTEHTLLSREFWDLAHTANITSLSGVPGQFDMLRRVGLEKRELKRLRMLTQAGGHLNDKIKRHFVDLAERLDLEFFVMYGQTEAGPRISYVPPTRLKDKLGSIGVPIPGGHLEADPETDELIYRGANVMMGYADTREELAGDDQLGGVLRTGDLGRMDSDGFFFLSGRLKRFIKLSGTRVNLDDVEAAVSEAFDVPAACVGTDDRLHVVLASEAGPANEVHAFLRERFDIFHGHVKVHHCDALPNLANGKLDYQRLNALTAREETR